MFKAFSHYAETVRPIWNLSNCLKHQRRKGRKEVWREARKRREDEEKEETRSPYMELPVSNNIQEKLAKLLVSISLI